MFRQFETDKDLETGGIYIDYGQFRVKIARAGGANRKFASYSEAKARPYRRAIQSGTIPETIQRELLYDIFAHAIILGWEVADGTNEDGTTRWKPGIHSKDGGVIEFSKENVKTTFRQLPDLFLDIQSQSDTIALFRREEMEDEAKNS